MVAANANAILGLGSRGEQKMLAEARAAYASGDYARTVEITETFMLKNETKRRARDAYALMGSAHKQQGAYDKALLAYSEAVTFFPKDIELNLALADVYSLGGLSDKAADIYKKVLALEPANMPARLALARVYLEQGFFVRAVNYFKEYVEGTKTEDAKVFYDYAQALFYAKDHEKALELALHSAQTRPSADTTLLIAKIYKAQGDRENAFKTVEAAARQEEGRYDIILTRALWLAFEPGHSQEALQIAEACLARHPENRLALFIKYMALRRQGKEEQGRKYLKAITRLDGNGFIERLAEKILEPASKARGPARQGS